MRIISSHDNLARVDHLARVLRQNGYPTNFIRSSSALPSQVLDPRGTEEDQEEESRIPVMMIPYISGISKDVRRGKQTTCNDDSLHFGDEQGHQAGLQEVCHL